MTPNDALPTTMGACTVTCGGRTRLRGFVLVNANRRRNCARPCGMGLVMGGRRTEGNQRLVEEVEIDKAADLGQQEEDPADANGL